MADEMNGQAEDPPAVAEARAYLRETTGAEVTPAVEKAGRALLERIIADTEQRAADAVPGGSAA
jgi:hypothetical protein